MMKKRLLSLLLCAVMLTTPLALCGCDGGGPAAPAASPAPSASTAPVQALLPPAEMLAAVTTPDPAMAGDVSEAALGFAADLLRQTEGENRLLSPVSILCALGMVLSGAKGETREQMEAVLGVSGEALNAFLGPWLSALAAEEDGALHAADGIWFTDDGDVHISDGFLTLNRDCYGAALEQCPMDTSALARINDFVKQNTRGMIEKILNDIPRDAVMVLVNALAFEANWESPYREDQLQSGFFTPENGEARVTDFLHSDENVWLSDENTSGFLKYYEGRRYAFAALLPAEGLAMGDYVASLTGEKLHALLTGAERGEVITATPKFECAYDAALGETLQAMGMSDAFDEVLADFSGLGYCDGGENIYISKVLHKTYLKLDEKGTKAGAATAVIMEKATAIREPKEKRVVILDRPFVYLLIDTETNLPLFIGVVNSVG